MKTHVTVIPADSYIAVDGHGLNFAFAAPDNLHALQWHNGAGHIEHTDGSRNTPVEQADYGNTVAPYVALWEQHQAAVEQEASRPLTEQEQIAAFTAAIQRRLDAFAQSRNYDGIMSAATHAGSEVPQFAAEGGYAVAMRDATWARAYEIMNAALASGAVPTWEEIEVQLPELLWPDDTGQTRDS